MTSLDQAHWTMGVCACCDALTLCDLVTAREVDSDIQPMILHGGAR